jgi:hypothetical protein
MILYVNGDSNSAGAEAVNSYAFAEDDPLYWGLGRKPHPDNERVSYGAELANLMGAIMDCDAESASSNDRIIRTTNDYLNQGGEPDLIVIGWSTWEREEWWDEETQRYWQINAGGIGEDWPTTIKDKYKKWAVSHNYQDALIEQHTKIWNFHIHLRNLKIKHLFFSCFQPLAMHNFRFSDWDQSYVEPYDPNCTYYNWLKSKGFNTVNPASYHFGPDAHAAWAEFLFQQLVQRNLTQ